MIAERVSSRNSSTVSATVISGAEHAERRRHQVGDGRVREMPLRAKGPCRAARSWPGQWRNRRFWEQAHLLSSVRVELGSRDRIRSMHDGQGVRSRWRGRCRAHLDAVGEDYAEHRRFAFGFGWAMVKGGLACMVHGLVPALFTDRGSRTVRAPQRRHRASRAARARSAAPGGASDPALPRSGQCGHALARRSANLGGAAAHLALARLHPRLLVERSAGAEPEDDEAAAWA